MSEEEKQLIDIKNALYRQRLRFGLTLQEMADFTGIGYGDLVGRERKNNLTGFIMPYIKMAVAYRMKLIAVPTYIPGIDKLEEEKGLTTVGKVAKLGDVLKMIRLLAGESRDTFAERLDVSDQQIFNLEKNEYKIKKK